MGFRGEGRAAESLGFRGSTGVKIQLTEHFVAGHLLGVPIRGIVVLGYILWFPYSSKLPYTVVFKTTLQAPASSYLPSPQTNIEPHIAPSLKDSSHQAPLLFLGSAMFTILCLLRAETFTEQRPQVLYS